MADFSGTSRQAIASFDQIYDSIQKKVFTKTGDALQARAAGTQAGIIASEAAAAIAAVIGLGISTVADLAALATDALTKVKQAGQGGITDFIAATLSDALLIDINSADIPIGTGNAGSVARASAIGQKWVDALKLFAHADGPVDGNTAEQGAAALCGIAMFMSANTSFLAFVGGLVPQIHLDELKELGEMLEKSLGIGRLTRRALTPLIQHAIAQPLSRKYAAQYRTTLLGVGELAKAINRGGQNAAPWQTLLTEHGLSDDQLAELVAQHKPRLKAEEWDVAGVIGAQRGDIDNLQDAGEGMDATLLGTRLQVAQYKRLERARLRVLSAVLSEISSGFVDPSALDVVMTNLQIPADEQALWRQAAGILGERTRKRIAQGDMEFLYEAGQITLSDVQTWAKSEGYSDADTQNLQLLFQLKAAAKTAKGTSGAAVTAAHLHAEHIAYVTDEITGLWGRAPSQAELDFWVQLLDMKQRTKGDVKTELKALPTTGPAIPPG